MQPFVVNICPATFVKAYKFHIYENSRTVSTRQDPFYGFSSTVLKEQILSLKLVNSGTKILNNKELHV